MKKFSFFCFIAGLMLLATRAPAGQEKMEVAVTNIIVPVRVLEGNNFVDNLTVEDFELFEDGERQEIQALYLIRNLDVQRQEGPRNFALQTSRNFYLLFQMTDYNPKLAEMVDYLFEQVLQPGDSLVLQTPMKNYSLSPKALATAPKKTLAGEMNSLLKRDIKTGNTEYNALLKDLRRIVTGISGTSPMASLETDSSATSPSSLEFMLNRYKETIRQMEEQRLMDEKKIIRFAYALKRFEGQKHVFLIYQREFRPEIPWAIFNRLQSMYQDAPNILGDLQDLFQLYTRNISINTELLKKAFADSSINFNFIFMNKEPDYVTGVVMREQSEDIFKAFSQVAQATGGHVDNSQNPVAGFRNAVENASIYYLLYYSPKNYRKDNQFKNIKVTVKNPAHTVQHRLGYFAN